MSRVEQLLDAEADKQARIDELTEDRQETARARMQELLDNRAERDAELWATRVDDPEATQAEYEAVEVVDRDWQWWLGYSQIMAAAQLQAWLEIYSQDMIEIAEEEGRVISDTTASMAREEQQEAARQGIGKQRFKDAKRRRSERRLPGSTQPAG